VIGKEVTYQQVPIERYAEIFTPKRPTHASTGGPAKSFLMQHLHEVAIDHSNGIFAGTNNYIAEIGGRPPMTVEEFVTRNREAFV
jgi:NAD(P)H dehydrogenase (quinone)